ncbi:MAG: hypothetical protein KF868_13910 [Acidobacteria bacterium]|nr:hypothetical protein [Acidobacteriota bacterium]
MKKIMSAATKWVYDSVDLKGLHKYVTSCSGASPHERLRLMIRHALFVVRERIADADLRNDWVRCDHFDEAVLFRYFSGEMLDEEMWQIEFDGRICEVCAAEFLAAGRTITTYATLFSCENLISGKAARTVHLEGPDINFWFDGKQPRHTKRELLRHIRICRRCRQQLRREAAAIRRISCISWD